jgi:DtxR family transcriptional regulator, Mn-dependent transcriptional regulator
VIARLQPDLILGRYSAMTAEEYETLSAIAPTVAQPDEFIDSGVPWREQLERTGQALGAQEEAAALREELEAAFADARASLPELEGATFTFASALTPELYVYTADDLRARFFADLGLDVSDEVTALIDGDFYAQISREQAPVLDADVGDRRLRRCGWPGAVRSAPGHDPRGRTGMAHDLIDSTEMYLRTVLELEEEGIPALRARLSERLGLSAPSVSEGVARLEEQGMLVLAPDRTVRFTAAGRDRAEHVMRKHRLAERLLVDVLGLEHEHAHEEACRWEHVISDRVEAKLRDFLGDPTTSPYGNPIPGAIGGSDDGPLRSLLEVPEGPVTIACISEHLQGDREVMQRFHRGGVIHGRAATLRRTGDAVVLEVDGDEVTLPADEARLVYVSAG